MIIKASKRFLKNFDAIKSKAIKEEILTTVYLMIDANTIEQLPYCKHMMGYINLYRLRVDDYRIGVHIFNNVVTLHQVAHRSTIYTYFPKYRKPINTFKKRK